MMPPETDSISADVWGAIFLATCLLPFALVALAVAIRPLVVAKPVPWWQDDQADEMLELGIDPEERWTLSDR
jgi:hypothetical protein